MVRLASLHGLFFSMMSFDQVDSWPTSSKYEYLGKDSGIFVYTESAIQTIARHTLSSCSTATALQGEKGQVSTHKHGFRMAFFIIEIENDKFLEIL